MPPTTPQLKRLFALARNAAISPDELKAIVRDRYGHASRRDLSDREYEELCVHLQEVSGDRAAGSGRLRAGELANEMEILAWLQSEKLPWPEIAVTSHDVSVATTLLDDFRRRRARYKRISVAQARTWLSWWGRYPLYIWRRATEVWLAGHRTKGERYFLGICQNIERDDELAA